MFTPTIASQGTDAQVADFLPKAQRYEIIGTYAQTEMGHGNTIISNNEYNYINNKNDNEKAV